MLDYISVTEDQATVDILLDKTIGLEMKDNKIYINYIVPSLKETIRNKYKKWYKGEQYTHKLARLESL